MHSIRTVYIFFFIPFNRMKRLNAEWIFEIHFCSKCLEKSNKFKSIMKNKEENFKLFIFQYTNSVQVFTFNLFVITKLKLLKQKIKRKPNRLLTIYIFFLLKTNKIFFSIRPFYYFSFSRKQIVITHSSRRSRKQRFEKLVAADTQ